MPQKSENSQLDCSHSLSMVWMILYLDQELQLYNVRMHSTRFSLLHAPVFSLTILLDQVFVVVVVVAVVFGTGRYSMM